MSDISKVKLSDGSEYDLKDQQLRDMIDILLGNKLPEEEDKD